MSKIQNCLSFSQVFSLAAFAIRCFEETEKLNDKKRENEFRYLYNQATEAGETNQLV